MRFVHFTALDGQTVAVSTDGSVILRPHLAAAESEKARTVIDAMAGQLLVLQSMAEVEDRFKEPPS